MLFIFKFVSSCSSRKQEEKLVRGKASLVLLGQFTFEFTFKYTSSSCRRLGLLLQHTLSMEEAKAKMKCAKEGKIKSEIRSLKSLRFPSDSSS